MTNDSFGARAIMETANGPVAIYRLDALEKAGLTKLSALPFSIRVLLESAVRHCNDREVTQDDVRRIAAWRPPVD